MLRLIAVRKTSAQLIVRDLDRATPREKVRNPADELPPIRAAYDARTSKQVIASVVIHLEVCGRGSARREAHR